MMEWSPQQAMKAYINTLHLSKVMNKQGCNMGWASKAPNIVEPECMELISALAAGNKAKVMVEITSGGLTPFTVALAVAAKQTGGRVVPPSGGLPHKDSADDDDCNNSTKRVASGAAGKNERRRLRDVVASEGVLTSVDFLVVDSKAAGEMKVEVNSKGCVVVATNLPQPQRLHERSSRGWLVGATKGGGGLTPGVTLPIGNGVEMTKIIRPPSPSPSLIWRRRIEQQ